MKLFFLPATFVTALGIAGSVLAQHRDVPIIGTLVFDQTLPLQVVPIDEAPGRQMNAGLFASADPEAVKKYMPGGTAPASVTTFVLFAGEDTVLFDAGLGGEVWGSKLNDLGVQPESVKLILLTHFHGDHTGGLFKGDARRFPNAKVLASKPEYDSRSGGFEKIKAAYGEDFVSFNFDDVVFENSCVKVKAMDAVGHTPGHTVFLLESKRKETDKLLIIGDLLHAAALQFPVPEACASFDRDQAKAIAARKKILDFAAQEKIPVGGMHLPSPNIGTVKKEGAGYAFEAMP